MVAHKKIEAARHKAHGHPKGHSTTTITSPGPPKANVPKRLAPTGAQKRANAKRAQVASKRAASKTRKKKKRVAQRTSRNIR